MKTSVRKIIRGGRTIRKQLAGLGLDKPHSPARKALAGQFRNERKQGIRIPRDYGVKPSKRQPVTTKPVLNVKPFAKQPPKFDKFAKTKPFGKKPPRFKAPLTPGLRPYWKRGKVGR